MFMAEARLGWNFHPASEFKWHLSSRLFCYPWRQNFMYHDHLRRMIFHSSQFMTSSHPPAPPPATVFVITLSFRVSGSCGWKPEIQKTQTKLFWFCREIFRTISCCSPQTIPFHSIHLCSVFILRPSPSSWIRFRDAFPFHGILENILLKVCQRNSTTHNFHLS